MRKDDSFIEALERWSGPLVLFLGLLSNLDKLVQFEKSLGSHILAAVALILLAAWTLFVWVSKVPSKIDEKLRVDRFSRFARVTAVSVLGISLVIVLGSAVRGTYMSKFWATEISVAPVFLPRDLVIDDINQRTHQPTVNVQMAVETPGPRIILLRKGEVTGLTVDEWRFVSEGGFIPKVKLVSVMPENPTIDESRRNTMVSLEFDVSSLIPRGDQYQFSEPPSRHRCGELRIRLFYRLGDSEQSEEVLIPIFIMV